jgi:hypothetical protein
MSVMQKQPAEVSPLVATSATHLSEFGLRLLLMSVTS